MMILVIYYYNCKMEDEIIILYVFLILFTLFVSIPWILLVDRSRKLKKDEARYNAKGGNTSTNKAAKEASENFIIKIKFLSGLSIAASSALVIGIIYITYYLHKAGKKSDNAVRI